MNVAEWIVSELIQRGVTHVFTLQGGYSMYLNDAIGHSALTPVYMLHESGAAYAAKGYAQASGKMGVCVITSGIAQTNALSGVTCAWSNFLPMFVISGDVRYHFIAERDREKLRQGGQQNVRINDMAGPVTKSIATVGFASQAQFLFDFMWKQAMAEPRGPVWMNIPIDVQQESV